MTKAQPQTKESCLSQEQAGGGGKGEQVGEERHEGERVEEAAEGGKEEDRERG